MMVATDVARLCEAVVEEELPHQEEVGGVDHQIQPRGQAAVSLEEAEFVQRRLLFPLSLFGQRAPECRSPLGGVRVGGQPQMCQQPLPQRLRKVVLEFLDEPLLAEHREQVTTLLLEKSIGERRRRYHWGRTL